MAKILKLDQHTANLIAAGEVIERAASVVKELVENSIDAGATKINISLLDSGLTEIVVSDNGSGMDPVDAKMSVEPHATSKIKDGNDLFRINSLGFRGEALPSIVSVSNFKIKTSADGLKGMMYSLRAGEMLNEAIIAYPKGTEIIVRNLFFNTPARLQNLQAPSVELSYVVDYVTKIALSRPDIAFKLTNNDRTIIQTYGTNRLLEVILNTYGDEVAKNMIEVFANNGYFKIGGYVSKPSVSRSTRNHINILVNKRIIKNYKIVNAIYEAYKERLVGGRYPITVIDITVDPSLVDVNIHPAKLEVRFSNENELLEMITTTIAETLAKTNLIVEVEKKAYDSYEWQLEEDEESFADEESQEDSDSFADEESQEINESPSQFVSETPNFPGSLTEEDFIDDDNDTAINYQASEAIKEVPILNQETYEQQEFLRETHQKDERVNKLPPMYYVGQVHGTYLIFQDEDSLYLVDQHAAYERINYEKILASLKKEDTINYELLIPIKLNFTTAEAILVKEKVPELARMGITVEDFGSGTFTIREVPIWFTKGKEKEFVEEIIFEFINNRKVDKLQFFDNLAKSLACKRSIKANQYLDKLHIDYLMEDLGRCEKPYSCPHGRPTIVKFVRSEIERWFKRVI